jgi:hypothetical protein
MITSDFPQTSAMIAPVQDGGPNPPNGPPSQLLASYNGDGDDHAPQSNGMETGRVHFAYQDSIVATPLTVEPQDFSDSLKYNNAVLDFNPQLQAMTHKTHLDQTPQLLHFHNWSNFETEQKEHPGVPEEVLRHERDSAERSTTNSIVPQDAILGDSGRTYHAYEEGKYFLPNDPVIIIPPMCFTEFANSQETEQDRLDLQHATIMRLLGRLSCAPMSEPPKYVLDVATGTGIWALDFGNNGSVD